jgi:hypothetical protein
MTRVSQEPYDRGMLARAALVPCFVGALLALPASAHAETATFEAINGPIVRVNLLAANVTIRTWTRMQIRIDADEGVKIERRSVNLPGQRDVPIFEGRISGKSGPILLPAETFVVNTLPKGKRDVIALTGSGNVSITLPESTPFIAAQVRQGSVYLTGYRAGTFIVRVRAGLALLTNDGGDGFVQVMRGTIRFTASAFDRVRVRSAFANEFFEGCRMKQIQASDIEGSILYDNGSFDQGLARFESERGSVAIGVTGSATISAHAPEGQINALPSRNTAADIHAGDGTIAFSGGGPVVTAASGSGDVYVYEGSLRNRRDLPASWKPFLTTLRLPGFNGTSPGIRPAFHSDRPMRPAERQLLDDEWLSMSGEASPTR